MGSNTEVNYITFVYGSNDVMRFPTKQLVSRVFSSIYYNELSVMKLIQEVDIKDNRVLDGIIDSISEQSSFLRLIDRDLRAEKILYFAGKESIKNFLPNLVESLNFKGFTLRLGFFGRNFGYPYEIGTGISRAHFIILTATELKTGVGSSFLLDLGSISGVKYICKSAPGKTLDTTQQSEAIYGSLIGALDANVGDEDEDGEQTSTVSRQYSSKASKAIKLMKKEAQTNVLNISNHNIVMFDKSMLAEKTGMVQTTAIGLGCIFLGNTSAMCVQMGSYTIQIMFDKKGQIANTLLAKELVETINPEAVCPDSRADLSWFAERDEKPDTQ